MFPISMILLELYKKKGKKLKRGVYEHKGTEEISKLANKLIFSDEGESDSEDTEITKRLALVII